MKVKMFVMLGIAVMLAAPAVAQEWFYAVDGYSVNVPVMSPDDPSSPDGRWKTRAVWSNDGEHLNIWFRSDLLAILCGDSRDFV